MTKALLLTTIQKSGTNLFRIALFNYLCHLLGDVERKTYDDMVAAFPNQIAHYRNSTRKPPRADLLPNGYADFVYGHNSKQIAQLDGPIVGLYRNPLDHLISAFFFYYADRRNPQRVVAHPREIVEGRLEKFARQYKAMQRIEPDGRALLLAYEDLFEFPVETLGRALRHYGLPYDAGLLRLAAEHASIRHVRADEDRVGFLHSTNRENEVMVRVPGARFVRDGSIGQWERYFSDKEVAGIKARLAENGVDPVEFVYEPRVIPAP